MDAAHPAVDGASAGPVYLASEYAGARIGEIQRLREKGTGDATDRRAEVGPAACGDEGERAVGEALDVFPEGRIAEVSRRFQILGLFEEGARPGLSVAEDL